MSEESENDLSGSDIEGDVEGDIDDEGDVEGDITEDEVKEEDEIKDEESHLFNINVRKEPLKNLIKMPILKIINKLFEEKNTLKCVVPNCGIGPKKVEYGFCNKHSECSNKEKHLYLSEFYNSTVDKDESKDDNYFSKEALHLLMLSADASINIKSFSKYTGVLTEIRKRTNNPNIAALVSKFLVLSKLDKSIKKLKMVKSSGKSGNHGKVLIFNKENQGILLLVRSTDDRELEKIFESDSMLEICDLIESYKEKASSDFDIIVKTAESPSIEAGTLREIVYFTQIHPLVTSINNSVNTKHQKLLGITSEYYIDDDGYKPVVDIVIAVPPNGETLSEYIKKTKEEERIAKFPSIFSHILFLYKGVFSLGFIHGDPKPKNMIVYPDGSVMLIDFGAWGFRSKENDGKDNLIPRTLSTPYVTAPEVFSDLVTSDKSELWSLGMIAGELLTKKDLNNLFDNDEDLETHKFIQNVLAKEITKHKLGYDGHFTFPNIPKEFKEVFNSILKFDSNKRLDITDIIKISPLIEIERKEENMNVKSPTVSTTIFDSNKTLVTFLNSVAKYYKVEFAVSNTIRLFSVFVEKHIKGPSKTENLKYTLMCCLYISLYILEQWNDSISLKEFLGLLDKDISEESSDDDDFVEHVNEILTKMEYKVYMML